MIHRESIDNTNDTKTKKGERKQSNVEAKRLLTHTHGDKLPITDSAAVTISLALHKIIIKVVETHYTQPCKRNLYIQLY